ncbi:hypothetical protein BpHYR1_012593 [Brachionus plicatilis]|uniref:Uncharacterized protein n=1 Tax=Brachionus plicatilis TaxID=10195 RepID=A0A3M7T250_BRAPC|nr:hypothetical protein BpHYR1_012593 [Brachionus plicatilis]
MTGIFASKKLELLVLSQSRFYLNNYSILNNFNIKNKMIEFNSKIKPKPPAYKIKKKILKIKV